MTAAVRLETFPLHLGHGATAVVEPAFTGMDWYQGYAARHAADGMEGRLVSMHTFTESWDSWEMHPLGDEVVVCTEGAITLIQETAGGGEVRTLLGAGDCAINRAGTWHTADVDGSATALFITAGMDTQGRAR
jgi:quercetin dioxygenase-like cupin family protein